MHPEPLNFFRLPLRDLVWDARHFAALCKAADLAGSHHPCYNPCSCFSLGVALQGKSKGFVY
jgi:hypothetical protein